MGQDSDFCGDFCGDFCVEAFLRHLAGERGLSPLTVKAYRRDLEDFSKFFAEYTEGTLNEEAFAIFPIGGFRAWLSAQLRRGLAPGSTARALSSLRGFNRFCQMVGRAHNPHIQGLQTPKKPQILPRPLAEHDSFRMLAAAAEHPVSWIALRDVALCTLLWGTGLRIAEALSVTRKMLKIDGQMLRVRGKGNKERLVPLLPVVFSACQEYLASYPHPLSDDAPIFRGVRGGVLSARRSQELFMKLRRQIGLSESVTPHAMRHSFASDLLKGSGDLRTIQELLGHASLSSTQRYTAVDRTALARIYHKAQGRSGRD